MVWMGPPPSRPPRLLEIERAKRQREERRETTRNERQLAAEKRRLEAEEKARLEAGEAAMQAWLSHVEQKAAAEERRAKYDAKQTSRVDCANCGRSVFQDRLRAHQRVCVPSEGRATVTRFGEPPTVATAADWSDAPPDATPPPPPPSDTTAIAAERLEVDSHEQRDSSARPPSPPAAARCNA